MKAHYYNIAQLSHNGRYANKLRFVCPSVALSRYFSTHIEEYGKEVTTFHYFSLHQLDIMRSRVYYVYVIGSPLLIVFPSGLPAQKP